MLILTSYAETQYTVSLTKIELDILRGELVNRGWTEPESNYKPGDNLIPPKVERCSKCSMAKDQCANPEHCDEELPPRMHPFTDTDFYAFGGAERLPDGGKPLMGVITLYGKEATFLISGQSSNPNVDEKWQLEIVQFPEKDDGDYRTYQRPAQSKDQALRIYELMQAQADNDNIDLVDVFSFSPIG
jgi:hypothetical protein